MENLVTPVNRVKPYFLACQEIHYDCNSLSNFGKISFVELRNALKEGAHYLDVVIRLIHDNAHITVKKEFTPFSARATFDDIRARMQRNGPAGLRQARFSIPNKGSVYRFRTPISYLLSLNENQSIMCAVVRLNGRYHVYIYQGHCSAVYIAPAKSNSQGVRIPG